MREFLSGRGVAFVDRNIRKSGDARAELEQRTGQVVVPQAFWRDHHVVGFDPDALDALVTAWTADAA